MQKKKLLSLVALLLISCYAFAYEVPKGWHKAGSDPDKYDMGTDKGAGQQGKNVATIKSIKNKIEGFGTLMQQSLPDQYRGKRVRMSGMMKAQGVAEWAGFWMRVDQANSNTRLAFDNMAERPVRGNSDWTRYEIVLDVPEKAANISYGALLKGTGQIWFDNISFEIVDNQVPATGIFIPQGPYNLNFEE